MARFRNGSNRGERAIERLRCSPAREAALLVLGAAQLAGAGPVEPLRPSDILTLTPQGQHGCPGTTVKGCAGAGTFAVVLDRIVQRDGTCAALALPAGQALIITSADYRVTDEGPTRPVRSLLELRAGSVTLLKGTFIEDTSKTAGGSVHVSPGIAVSGPSPTLCAHETNIGAFPEVLVHGYVTADR